MLICDLGFHETILWFMKLRFLTLLRIRNLVTGSLEVAQYYLTPKPKLTEHFTFNSWGASQNLDRGQCCLEKWRCKGDFLAHALIHTVSSKICFIISIIWIFVWLFPSHSQILTQALSSQNTCFSKWWHSWTQGKSQHLSELLTIPNVQSKG